VILMRTALCLFGSLSVIGCSSPTASDAKMQAKQSEVGPIESTCPDDPKIDLRDCEFAKIIALLKGTDTAQERYRTASAKCSEYDQVTLNFCGGKLLHKAEAELLKAYGATKPSPSVASYLEWTSRIGQNCTPDYPMEEGGSGYSIRITYCEMTKYAEKIDKLNSSVIRK
jgi:uncharacterized protein YecT (DUF1311 family)